MARNAAQNRRATKVSRRHALPPGASASTGRKASSRRTPGMLQSAGSVVGKVLRESTDTVKEVGAGLVNTAREVITSTVTSQHDAVSVLKAQHREVEALFAKVLSSRDNGTRRELLRNITSALTMHTKIEEDIFYPAVRSLGTKETEQLIDEAFEEHHVVDLVLAELPKVNPSDDRFIAKMTVLSEVVDHHVKEEERDMFKRAQQLGTGRLEQLGARLEAAAARHRTPARAASGTRE
jgi:hemerythrin superfamily protein